MSEELKNSENLEENSAHKPFTVNISEEDFNAEEIPAPEGDAPVQEKPHKVVRYVESPKEEKPAKENKAKGGFLGEFIAGAAAGAKTVGEGISAGVKAVSEKSAPKEEKPVKTKESRTKEDETQFPKEENKSSGDFMNKLRALPVGAVIGGAAVILAVLVAIILLIATSCTPQENNGPSPVTSSGNITVGPENPSDPGDSEDPGDKKFEVPTRKNEFVEAFNGNNDVVGWLYIPELSAVDAGVCFSYDDSYPYDKRDINGKKVPNTYWIDGAYYTHYRNIFGDTADELSTNTVIFGHSDLGLTNLSYANDDPTGPLFSQLFNFKNPSFAEKTPYIYLTLPGEDTVWEIFSVFYNDAKAENKTFAPFYKKNAGDLWYIEPAPNAEEYKLMLERIQARSLYDYDVEVNEGDRILTLSTCTVGYGLNSRANYRFVIVAKLVKDVETNHIDKNASFAINENAPVPNSFKDEFAGYVKNWRPTQE